MLTTAPATAQKNTAAPVQKENPTSAEGTRGGVFEAPGGHPGQRGGDHRSQSDKQALRGEAARALVFGQKVSDGAEKLHADVDGSFEHPQQASSDPDGRRVEHPEPERAN